MQIPISSEAEVQQMAMSAGFDNVEDYVNRLIKKEADLQAVREGIEDVEAGRLPRSTNSTQNSVANVVSLRTPSSVHCPPDTEGGAG